MKITGPVKGIFTLLLIGFFVVGSASAQTPRTISYQGQLLNSSTAKAETLDMTFDFLESGGKQLWSEQQSVRVDEQGVFSVILGKLNAINLPFDKPYSLRFKVVRNGEVLIQTEPFGLTSVPYAFTASHLENNPKLTELSDVSKSATPLQDQVLRWKDGQWVFEHIAGSAGVSSFNGTKGDVTIAEGNGIKIQAGANGLFTILVDTSALLTTFKSDQPSLKVPVGTVISYAGEAATVPSGWLLCKGDTVLRSDYPELFDVIGKNHLYGDAPTNRFTLPDYRGLFLRCADLGGGVDSDVAARTEMRGRAGASKGAQVGSVQADAFQGHWHYAKGTAISTNTPGNTVINEVISNSDQGAGSGDYHYVLAPSSDGLHGSPRVSSESRPKNAYVLYLIKAKP